MGLKFETKEVVPDHNATLGIMSAEISDTYGPQLAIKVKVLDGDSAGHTFMDYSALDEDSGNIRQGTKAWSIFQAALGVGFHEEPDVEIEDLVGERIVSRITQTKTGSRNKLEFGTIGPYQPPVSEKKAKKRKPEPEPEVEEDEDDEDDPFAKAPF